MDHGERLRQSHRQFGSHTSSHICKLTLLQALLNKMLAMLKEYGECDSATNGDQALEMFCLARVNMKPYDLITLDIDMPGMNGLELLRQIVNEEEGAITVPSKKVMVSAGGTSENVLSAAKHKCDGFIVKPVKKDLLEEKLWHLNIYKLPVANSK